MGSCERSTCFFCKLDQPNATVHSRVGNPKGTTIVGFCWRRASALLVCPQQGTFSSVGHPETQTNTQWQDIFTMCGDV